MSLVDFSSLLELSRDCSRNEVEKAYKRLSERYNPASNPGNRELAKKFVQIKRAKEILSNWNLRNILNHNGYEMVKLVERHQKTGHNDNEQSTRDNTIVWKISLEQLYTGDTIKFGYNR